MSNQEIQDKIQLVKLTTHNESIRIADAITDVQINLILGKKSNSELLDELQNIVAKLRNLSADIISL